MVILALCTDVNIIKGGVLGMGHSTWENENGIFPKTEPKQNHWFSFHMWNFDTKIIL